MKKILIIFLPIIPFLLIILEVFLSFKIGKISFLEPIRILLANFSENANFKFMNSALLGLFVSSALIAFYSIIVFRFIKMSILLPCKYYFGSHSNSNILLRKKLHNLSGINIFEIFSFYIFAYKITNTKDFAIKDEELELASLNKKWYHKFSQLNVILKRHIGDENFSKNIEIKEKEYIQFAINKAKLTTNEVIKRF